MAYPEVRKFRRELELGKVSTVQTDALLEN